MNKQFVKAFVLCLILGILGVMSAQAQTQTPGAKKFKEGTDAAKNQNYAEAIQKFNEAINLEPAQYKYYVSKAKAQMKLKPPDMDGAIASYQTATQKNATYAAGFKQIANIYNKKKDYPNAVKALNDAFKAEGDAAKKLNYKLLAAKIQALKMNNSSGALADLQEAKQIAPNDPKVLKGEGDIYMGLQNWQNAITAYQKAVQQTTDLPSLQAAEYVYNLARAQFKAGQSKEADATAEKLKGTPFEAKFRSYKQTQGARGMLGRANAYLKVGATNEAGEYITKALESKDLLDQVYAFQAKYQLSQGQATQAIASQTQAVDNAKVEVDKMKQTETLLKMQMANRDFSGASSTVDKILAKKDPKLHQPYLEKKAIAQFQANDYSGASSSADKIIALTANKNVQSQYHFLKGMCALKSNNSTSAKESFAKVAVGGYKKLAKDQMEKIK